MTLPEITWSTSLIVIALLGVGLTFFLAWRLVVSASRGNRKVRREEHRDAGDDSAST